MNLADGGDEGLRCFEKDYDTDEKIRQMGTVCPWDDIPPSVINSSNPIIRQRTRLFNALERLALDGIEKYWSRNTTYNVYVKNEKYNLFVKAINTSENSMNELSLIFNTNTSWGRSGNPGFFGKIFYNIGYCNFLDWYEPSFLNSWGY